MKNLKCSVRYLDESSTRRVCEYLIKEHALCKFTLYQIFKKFGSYENHHPKLPESLDKATGNIFASSTKHNFSKRIRGNALAKNQLRFYSAMLSESSVCGKKVPVFQKIFSFLPQYANEPILT